METEGQKGKVTFSKPHKTKDWELLSDSRTDIIFLITMLSKLTLAHPTTDCSLHVTLHTM